MLHWIVCRYWKILLFVILKWSLHNNFQKCLHDLFLSWKWKTVKESTHLTVLNSETKFQFHSCKNTNHMAGHALTEFSFVLQLWWKHNYGWNSLISKVQSICKSPAAALLLPPLQAPLKTKTNMSNLQTVFLLPWCVPGFGALKSKFSSPIGLRY